MTKAYVITIMDNDKSVEVAKRCVGSAQLRGTEVEMFPAITPKDDPVKLLTDKGIDPKAFDEVYSRNLNCIAAFLSHILSGRSAQRVMRTLLYLNTTHSYIHLFLSTRSLGM